MPTPFRQLAAAALLAAFATVSPHLHAEAACPAAPNVTTEVAASTGPSQLIVIGFLGGTVSAKNLAHKEAVVARDLQARYPDTVHAEIFANHHAGLALRTVLRLLDRKKLGCPTDQEKSVARIIIYGHSWGASETVTLARKLNDLHIPVLLTIQVDSVQKPNEDDESIPPNVHEAINFYQVEGFLHGRTLIAASDPAQTTIIGNFVSSYKATPVALDGYPWYARAFMKQHIEIENDPAVWNRIESMIQDKIQTKIAKAS